MNVADKLQDVEQQDVIDRFDDNETVVQPKTPTREEIVQRVSSDSKDQPDDYLGQCVVPFGGE